MATDDNYKTNVGHNDDKNENNSKIYSPISWINIDWLMVTFYRQKEG